MRPRRSLIRTFLVAAVATGASLALAGPATGQVDEGWGQYQGNAARTGAATAAPAPPYTMGWQAEAAIGTPQDLLGFPVPVVVGGLAVVVGRESVIAVAVADGTVAWSIERAPGPSTPAATTEDGSLVLVTEGGGDDDTATSEASTPSAATPTVAVTPSPSAPPDLAVVSALVALDPETGERVWEHALPDVSRTGPAILGDRAFVGTDGGDLIAVEAASGDALWDASVGDEVVLPLAAADDLVLAAAASTEVGGSSVLVAVGAADGEEAWRHTPALAGSPVGAPSVGDGTAYVALGDRSLVALELADGTERWSAPMNRAGGLPPTIQDDLVVAVDASGQIYGFDTEDGQERWDHALNLGFVGAPVAVPGAIVVPGDDRTVASLDPENGELIDRLQVSGDVVVGIAATPDTLVASVSSDAPSLLGLVHDDDRPLVHVPSPTTPDLPSLLGAWLVAAVPLVAILWVVGRRLWTALPPIELPVEDAVSEASGGGDGGEDGDGEGDEVDR
ncbi:MAG TPA: PQQ-binding-like beta-propeller repeat protein [Actinomycetota bacterium]